MTDQQKAKVDQLVALGGKLDDNASEAKLVFVWLNGHCFMVTPDGEIDEL